MAGPAGLLLPLWLLVAAFGPYSCSEEAGPAPGNLAPITYLAIQGTDLDTLDYRQILHWWGSDSDGEIAGYCVKWDGEWTPPPGSVRCEFDTTWVFTTATTDTFAVPTVGTFAERTFYVRAVDDDGALDPIGRSQLFRLKNWRPDLDWSRTILRPTASLPAITFAWSPRDLDGRETVNLFRYWLDGQDSSRAAFVTDSLIGLAPEDFEGRYGTRTLSVQAFDDALTSSNVIRHTWTVEEATGRYLLIDNVGSFVPGNSREDGFYRAILDSVAAGDYFVYDVEVRGDFRSDREVGPLLSLFDGVVWYGGVQNARNDRSVYENLLKAERGLGDYLNSGGRVLIAALNAVGDTAGLSRSFARERFGADDFFRKRGDNDIDLPSGSTLFTELGGTLDSLQTASSALDADFIIPHVAARALFELSPDSPALSGAEPDPAEQPASMGVLREDGPGRAVALTFLLSRATRFENANRYGTLVLRRLFRP